MNEIEIIKEYFHGKTKGQMAQLMKKFFIEYDDIKKYCTNILQNVPEYEKIQNIIYSIIFNFELKKCKTCGKFLKYSVSQFRMFCSCKCAQQNENTRKLMSKSINRIISGS